MTDELTPEEREALRKLPKERMPSAGLEERVVGALREHGVLSKPRRRAIEITNGRVAALLAACVVLVIGAYSIGLHRGVGDQVLPDLAKVDSQGDDRTTVERPRTDQLETAITGTPEAETSRPDATRKVVPPAEATDADEGDVKAPKEESPTELHLTPSARSDEQTVAGRGRLLEEQEERLVETTASDVRASRAQEKPPPREQAPKTMMEDTAHMMQPESEGVARFAQPRLAGEPPLAFATTLSFLLNGTRVVVDAPESVRVTHDEVGRVIVIYTSDGPIRFRLADDD